MGYNKSGDGQYNEAVDEAWLIDRMNLRKKTPLSAWAIFPRSPSPPRLPPGRAAGVATDAPETQEQAPPMTAEEEKRNDRFQQQLKKAAKGEDKAAKKDKKKEKKEKEKEEGSDKESEEDKKAKKKE